MAVHSKILQAQIEFQHAAIEVIRRELISYEMLISNLAEQTKRQRMELSVIAQYIRKTLESNKSASKVTEDASKEKSASKEKGSDKAEEAGDPSKTAGELRLPRVVLSVVLPNKHEYRCPIYNLKFN